MVKIVIKILLHISKFWINHYTYLQIFHSMTRHQEYPLSRINFQLFTVSVFLLHVSYMLHLDGNNYHIGKKCIYLVIEYMLSRNCIVIFFICKSVLFTLFNPDKAGLFDGSFFWRGLTPALFILRRTNLISIKLYTIVK